MGPNFYSRWIAFPLLLILAAMACGTPVTEVSSPETEPTAIQDTPTGPVLENTPITQPTATEEVAQESTPDNQPACTVLSETLNLRAGPSQLYRPPIRALPSGSTVTPLGYLPKGLIQGRWAYVRDRSSQDEGWVSAEANFLSCNFDLTSLPAVDYDPPPPYTPVSDTSPGPGTCGDVQVSQNDGAEYNCDVVFSNGFPVQFIVYKNGQEAGKGEGVQNVQFSVVDKNGNPIYNKTENDKAYCVFGGDSPCPIWTLENYLYRWGPGGPLLEPGTYTLKINPTLEDQSVNLFWSADITVTLPF